MALTAYLVVLFHLCRSVSSAPFDTIPTDATTEAPVLVTQIVTSNIEVIETSTIILQTTPPAIVPPVPPALSTISPVPQTTLPAQQEASTISPIPRPVTNVVTVIATSTPPPVTVTVSIPPATVTQTVVTTLPSSTIPSSSSIASAQTAWTAPAQMTDLASFNISYFPYGQDNVAIVNGTTTANASADNLSLAAAAAGTANTESSNSSAPPQPMMNATDAALQLFYPAGSINPESEPQGGADFYASPIDLSKANNVTLEYSVYFPADFDWVLAGKLPGLYGGHSGCSGGNDARSCFSTRLMWRAKGVGELYLYAPKDKQTKELCSAPPQSVCDQEYGLSVGRGSFNFTPGAWTHVRQTVTLNTPGGQDGGFVLEVNGQEVMRRADVFYRGVDTTSEPPDDDGGDDDDGLDEDEPGDSDDGSGGDEDDGGDEDGDGEDGDGEDGDGEDGDGEDGDGEGDDESPAPQQPSSSSAPPQPTAEPAPLVDPGAVPILGPLLNGLRFRVMGSPHYIDIASGENVSQLLTLQARDDSVPLWLSGASSPAFILPSVDQNTTAVSVTPSVVSVTTTSVVAAEALTQTMSVQATTTAVIYVDASQSVTSGSFVAEAQGTPKPVGFSGLFFSSFFGGHEEKYASPRDQYTWFKDFALTVNG